MFFPRLRRQAKWAFVFLALVFGVGFVVFGVGGEVPGGIADVLQRGAAGDGPSVGEARERLADNPNDPQALRDLATALNTDGRPDEAIPPLERYTTLRPKDEAALNELAILYLGRATRLREQVIREQTEGQIILPSSEFLPPPTTPLGQALAVAPLEQAILTRTNERLMRVYNRMQTAYTRAKLTYARIAALSPEDATVQLQLAQAAEAGGDEKAALAAYRRFLELAPEDPQAPLVRQQVARLRASVGTAGG